MFKHRCTECHQIQLVFPSQIRSLTNTTDGIEVLFTCWCGAEQCLCTGRRSTSCGSRGRAAVA